MPQKKNPDIAELVRGKSARVIGDVNTLLTMMKGLPLAYNKDMQEDKEALFDAIDEVKLCLPVFTDMMATITVHKDKMRENDSLFKVYLSLITTKTGEIINNSIVKEIIAEYTEGGEA